MRVPAAGFLEAWPPHDGEDRGPLRRSSVRESHFLGGSALPSGEGVGVSWFVRDDPALGHMVFHNGTLAGYHAMVIALGPGSDALDGIARRAPATSRAEPFRPLQPSTLRLSWAGPRGLAGGVRMLSNSLTLRFGLVSSLGLALAGACSATGNSQFTSSNGTHSGAGAGNGTGGAPSGSSSGISLGGSFSSSGAGASTSGSMGGSCAAQPYQAQQLPLDMYIMQDQSGSMSDTVAGGGTKWAAVTGALNTFVGQSGLTDISVGIQYFAQGGSEGCTCTTNADCTIAGDFCLVGLCFSCATSAAPDSCNASDYATPEVEIAPLPGVAASITTSLAKHKPATGTPTGPALQGALDHAKAWAASHPGHVVVAVLATDGEPQECSPTDQSSLANIAAAALAGTPSVKTFAIGVFATADMPTGPNLLNAIAAAGGTGQAFNINTTQNVNQQFLAALNAIRGTALGCQYSIPVPTSGTPDYNAVNVQYTPGSGGAPQAFLQYPDQAHCPASGDGWYYDNDTAPTQILLCPSTCTTVSADSTGQIDILLGCQTQKGTT